MRTLVELADTEYSHLRHHKCLEHSLNAIELARRVDDPRAGVSARFFATGAQYNLGNLEESRRHAAAALVVAEKLRDSNWLQNALWRNEIIARLEGDWPAARVFSDRGLAVHSTNLMLLETRVLLEYEAGDFGQGEAYLEQLLES